MSGTGHCKQCKGFSEMKYAESQWDVTKSFSQINLTGKFKPYERSVIFHKIVLPWNLLAGINTSNADFFRPKWCEREAKNLCVLSNFCNYAYKEHDFFSQRNFVVLTQSKRGLRFWVLETFPHLGFIVDCVGLILKKTSGISVKCQPLACQPSKRVWTCLGWTWVPVWPGPSWTSLNMSRGTRAEDGSSCMMRWSMA